jgi:hypothetical protein
VADIPKVLEDQFKAAIRALLNTPPMPMAEIPRKHASKPRKHQPSKEES